MPEKKQWIDKVIETFVEEVGTLPVQRDEQRIVDSIMTVIQFRAVGLDWRKIGLLAADVYRMVHAARANVIEDIARVAAAHEREGAGDVG